MLGNQLDLWKYSNSIKKGFWVFFWTTCSLLIQRLALPSHNHAVTVPDIQSWNHVSLVYTRHVRDARKMRPMLCVYLTWVKLKHFESNVTVGSVSTPLLQVQLPSLQKSVSSILSPETHKVSPNTHPSVWSHALSQHSILNNRTGEIPLGKHTRAHIPLLRPLPYPWKMPKPVPLPREQYSPSPPLAHWATPEDPALGNGLCCSLPLILNWTLLAHCTASSG